MDRDTVLKHSKAIRLEHKVLPEFIELLEELCRIRECPEYLQALISMISSPEIGSTLIIAILEYFEKEYHIIRIEQSPNPYGVNKNKLINII